MRDLDLAGIGIGPFNLSLAALLDPLTQFRARFFDQRTHFAWHPDQMLPGARLQTSFLKDLVTPVDPTSRHSFLNYLVAKGRFYEFLNADQTAILRAEFADYLAWVAGNLTSLTYRQKVQEITLDGDRLVVHGSGESVRTRAVVVGTGKAPYLPPWAERAAPGACFHATQALRHLEGLAGRSIAVVGGGQSGAELFLAIAQGRFGEPRRVTWISRRPTFAALDETHFVNEWFTPGFVDYFHSLDPQARAALRPVQKLAGDGISAETLRDIYQHLYERRHVSGQGPLLSLLPAHEVVDCRRDGPSHRLALRGLQERTASSVDADILVLATGFAWRLPACLEPLAGRFEHEGQMPRLNRSYRVAWDGPKNLAVYLQNGGLHSHGIADPQLSLMAWRAATIINDVAAAPVYPVQPAAPMLDWRARQANVMPERMAS